MKDLTIINHDGIHAIDSREVAEMVERPHNDLLKTIHQYCKYLAAGDFSLSEYFIPSTYTDKTGRSLPCYLLTKLGCDMVANKMTGEKGTWFTAAYAKRFREMESALTSNTLPGTYLDALKALVASEEEKLQLVELNTIMRPKADYFDELVDRNLLTGIRETAKGFAIGQKVFVNFLLNEGYCYRDGKKKLVPYMRHVTDGLFEQKEQYNETNQWSGTQTLITPKGRETFRLLLKGLSA